jgi:hypothetical protein
MAMDNEIGNDVFGDVIYSYSRKQALDDGILVDLNQYIPVDESGYKYPAACTAAVHSLIQRAVDFKDWCNDYQGVVWDILWMSRAHQIKTWETGALFKVIIVTGEHGTDSDANTHTLKIEVGPGDNAEPALTIMMPDED